MQGTSPCSQSPALHSSCRQEDRDQNCDDRDDYEQLHQREGSPICTSGHDGSFQPKRRRVQRGPDTTRHLLVLKPAVVSIAQSETFAAFSRSSSSAGIGHDSNDQFRGRVPAGHPPNAFARHFKKHLAPHWRPSTPWVFEARSTTDASKRRIPTRLSRSPLLAQARSSRVRGRHESPLAASETPAANTLSPNLSTCRRNAS